MKLITIVTRGYKKLIDEIIETVFSFCNDPNDCDDAIYEFLIPLLVKNNICVNHVRHKLWKPFKSWDGLHVRVRNTVLRRLKQLGYTPEAIILFGSMASKSSGHDIDLAIFLKEYVEPEKLEEIEIDLKATWDAKASLLHWPPLDPFLFSGYKPLWVKSREV